MAEPIDIELQLTKAPKPNMIEEESGKRRNVQQQRWRCVPVVMSILVLLMLVLVAVTGRFTHSGELRTRGFYPKNTNFAIKAENSSDRIAAMLQSMCGPYEEGCTYNNPSDKDPEPSDPGSSDKGASPDGSSCEMFELGCLNPRSSDTKQPEEPMQPKQPEEPKQPEVAETETVPMEPLSNTSKKNLLMKWMTWAQSYVTYVRANSFIWLNESAAMPYISEWNWQMATTALELMAELYSPSSTNSTWSLEEKRVYAHWADYWVLQPKLGEYNTTELVLKFRLQNWVETIRTQFDQLQLQFNAAS